MSSERKRRQRSSAPSVGSLVTTAVVAVGIYQLTSWAWESWNNTNENDDEANMQGQPILSGMRDALLSDPPQQQNQQHHRQRWRLRRQRMERCREETSNALRDFLPTLRRAVENQTDISEETKKLKKLRSERRDEQRFEEKELWDSIKIKAMTRMITTAYGHSILFLVLTMQVHLLGGRLFDEQMKLQTTSSTIGVDSLASDRMGSYQASHRLVLTRTYDFFFEKGIGLLLQTVEGAVMTVIADWDVTNPASIHTRYDMLNDAIQQIREIVEGRTRRSPRRPRSLLRFLLPPEQGVEPTFTDDGLAQSILDETWDLIESPVFEDAQRDSLAATFDIMRDQSWSKIFVEAHSSWPQHASCHYTTKPLAHIVIKLKATSNSFFDPEQTAPISSGANRYIATIQRIPTIVELGDVSFN